MLSCRGAAAWPELAAPLEGCACVGTCVWGCVWERVVVGGGWSCTTRVRTSMTCVRQASSVVCAALASSAVSSTMSLLLARSKARMTPFTRLTAWPPASTAWALAGA